jgi:hypothetical protein
MGTIIKSEASAHLHIFQDWPSSVKEDHMARTLALVLSLLVILSVSTNAQDTIKTYNKYVIVRQNGDRMEGRDGTLTPTQFNGVLLNGTQFNLQKNEIKTLYIEGGTRAGTYALYGGAIGLVTSLASILGASSSVAGVDEEKAIILTAALTGGGAIIGGLIGSSSTEWRIEPVVTLVPKLPKNSDCTAFALRFSIKL